MAAMTMASQYMALVSDLKSLLFVPISKGTKTGSLKILGAMLQSSI
jgi:hypothetical protein